MLQFWLWLETVCQRLCSIRLPAVERNHEPGGKKAWTWMLGTLTCSHNLWKIRGNKTTNITPPSNKRHKVVPEWYYVTTVAPTKAGINLCGLSFLFFSFFYYYFKETVKEFSSVYRRIKPIYWANLFRWEINFEFQRVYNYRVANYQRSNRYTRNLI